MNQIIFNESEQLNLLKQMLDKAYGHEQSPFILNGMMSPRVVTLRVNTLKSTITEVLHILDHENITYERVSWFDQALIVDCDEKIIEKLTIYEEGKIYLQSLSSMLPPLIMNPKESKDILDMAAAPGGKTSLIAQLTHNKSSITACEAHPIRAEKLKFNMKRQGVKNISILVQDALKLDDFFRFDHILLDAPCSGSGTILFNDLKTYAYFSEKLVNHSTQKQMLLLKKAIDLIKPGQEIIYSTCSILPQENEELISKVLKSKQVEVVPIEKKYLDITAQPSSLEGALFIPPSRLYEGFFVVKLKKKNK